MDSQHTLLRHCRWDRHFGTVCTRHWHQFVPRTLRAELWLSWTEHAGADSTMDAVATRRARVGSAGIGPCATVEIGHSLGLCIRSQLGAFIYPIIFGH